MAKRVVETDRGWVDLSNLETTKCGNISWENSVGKTIEFQYIDICSTILVSGYHDKKKVYIDIDGYAKNCLVHTTTILRGSFGDILGNRYYKDFKYEIGDIVNASFLITGRERDGSGKKIYYYTCLNDGYRGSKTENGLKNSMKCPVCSNRVILKGYNDVATTHPHAIKYFKNKEDAYKYSAHSGKRVWFKCPECGNEKYISIDCAFNNKFSCSACGDNSSYNNKFIYFMLKQLQESREIKFFAEHSFHWSRNLNNTNGKRIYDFYIKGNKEIIIEAHGLQHYSVAGFRYTGGRTLQEERENDIFKYELAMLNGFTSDTYVVIDCRKSKMEFIKKSIMESNLPKLLNFSEEDIDWTLCDKYACNNLIKIVCDYWNNGIHNASEIARIIGKSHCTVSEYLRKGNALGWVEYEPKHKIPVLCLDNNYVFPNSTVCSQFSEELLGVHISKKSVINNLCGDTKSTHGFHFAHITRKEFNKIKEEDPERVFFN